MSDRETLRALLSTADRSRPVVVLTGAGVSAESGIPTFRGPEGYWSVGSKVYHPQEMATQAAFRRMPRDNWCFPATGHSKRSPVCTSNTQKFQL